MPNRPPRVRLGRAGQQDDTVDVRADRQLRAHLRFGPLQVGPRAAPALAHGEVGDRVVVGPAVRRVLRNSRHTAVVRARNG